MHTFHIGTVAVSPVTAPKADETVKGRPVVVLRRSDAMSAFDRGGRPVAAIRARCMLFTSAFERRTVFWGWSMWICRERGVDLTRIETPLDDLMVESGGTLESVKEFGAARSGTNRSALRGHP
jgi:hypothetical protein